MKKPARIAGCRSCRGLPRPVVQGGNPGAEVKGRFYAIMIAETQLEVNMEGGISPSIPPSSFALQFLSITDCYRIA